MLWSPFHFQDIKPKKTKNKKGEGANGKKKAKKEPEEKWKWLVSNIFQLSCTMELFSLCIWCLSVHLMNEMWRFRRLLDGQNYNFLC